MVGVPWPEVWTAVAVDLNESWEAGLGRLVSEDVVRFATVRALVANGVPAARLEAEWRRSGVRDAVDLVVTQDPRAAIEFKFPREPREENAAWTTHLGEVLKDFYRLAHMPKEFQGRWCVQLISPPFRKYLTKVESRYGLHIALSLEDVTELRPDDISGLPKTVRTLLDPWMGPDAGAARAWCVDTHPVGDSHLVVHRVEASEN